MRTALLVLGALLAGVGLLGVVGLVFLRVATAEPPRPEETFAVDATIPQRTRPLSAYSYEVWVGRLGGGDVPCTLKVTRSDGSLVGESHGEACSISARAARGEVWSIEATAPGAEPKSVGAARATVGNPGPDYLYMFPHAPGWTPPSQ